MNSAIDLDNISYKIQMINNTIDDGHADYLFKVVGPNGISFSIVDRYSSMRAF